MEEIQHIQLVASHWWGSQSLYWAEICLISLSMIWMRTSNASSVSSQRSPNWAGVLISWKVGRIRRGIWVDWVGRGCLSEVQQGQVLDSALQSQKPHRVETWPSGKEHASTGQEVLNMWQQCAKRLLLAVCVKPFCGLKETVEKSGSLPAILKLSSHHTFKVSTVWSMTI